jgi:hypothetical protein
VKPHQRRAEEQRQTKLDEIRQQIEAGTLVVRKMTREERKRFPPRPHLKKRRPGS